MDPKDQLLRDIIQLPKMMSARVVWLISVGAAFLLENPERVPELLSHSPVPAWALPLVGAFVINLCQTWPQATLIKPTPAPTPAPGPSVGGPSDGGSQIVVMPPAPAPAPVEPPVLTDEVLPAPLDGEAVLTALRLRYPDLSDRSIESLRAIAKAIPQPPTKGTAP